MQGYYAGIRNDYVPIYSTVSTSRQCLLSTCRARMQFKRRVLTGNVGQFAETGDGVPDIPKVGAAPLISDFFVSKVSIGQCNAGKNGNGQGVHHRVGLRRARTGF